jgi:hypothetical protein
MNGIPIGIQNYQNTKSLMIYKKNCITTILYIHYKQLEETMRIKLI